MGIRKIKNPGSIDLNKIYLSEDRKIMFRRVRKMFPKGDPKMQIKMCETIEEDRIPYYLKYIFNKD